MPEDQGMLDTLGNAVRLTRPQPTTIPALSPHGDSVLQIQDVKMHRSHAAAGSRRIAMACMLIFAASAAFGVGAAHAEDAAIS